jgi:long-chain acyl-CoA synthetase
LREFASPPTYVPPPRANLTDDVVTNGVDHPDAVVLSRRDGAAWTDVTAAEFLSEVRAVAKGLVAAGVEPGDRVLLLSRTRYEWTLMDYAIWFAAAVTVPVYETSSPDQIAWLVSDSGARVAVVETADHLARVTESAGEAGLASTWVIDEGAVTDLRAAGEVVDDEQLEVRRAALHPDSLATIIYTSGTTGRPKGCMLTHGNFLHELGSAVEELDALFAGEDAATLLFLPLAHVFARVIQVGAIRTRARLGYSPDIRHLTSDLESFEPSFLLAVPRVFEKLFNSASQKAAADGRGRTFDKAAETAIAYSRALESGRPGRLLRARHAVFDRLVYSRLRDALGGRCAYAVSGGAPLGERLGHFYRGIGVTVLEGYGLTETTAAITVNVPDSVKIGTVGRPLGGAAVRVAEDGELHVRGGQVVAGYWQNPEATRETIGADGWLRTGDLGEIDDEGFVRVTGRKKEILVTAGGKNVAPAGLEDHIRAHPLVSQCLVVGDGRPFIGALVTLDADAVRPWAETHGKVADLSDLVDDEDVRAEIQSAVDEANRSVSQAESIRKFTILPVDWTEEAGQLTPSLKLKRAVVMGEFRREVDDLYQR